MSNNLVIDVNFTKNTLHFTLADGREISAPLEWFPRLNTATTLQKNHWTLIANGIGVHWPDIDEDISVKSLLSAKS
jgi:hypothetical protein